METILNDKRNDGGNAEENLPEIIGGGQLAVDLDRAAIDMQIATAHKYPRTITKVIEMIGTMALYSPDAAENCIYSLPRDGKAIIGPSIGFANVVASSWGNCIDGSRWVATDRREKVVIAEGVFHDLQTNRKVIIAETRRISNKKGGLYNDDMIVTTAKAAGAIARRNAILQIVPRAVWHPIYMEALGVVRGTVETFAENKDKAFKAMTQFGVKPEQILMALGLRGAADLTFEHIPTIRGMYSALRDGSMTVEEMFDPRRMTGTAFDQVDNPLQDEERVDPQTGEVQAATQGSGTATQGSGGASQSPAAATDRLAPDPEPQNSAASEPGPAGATEGAPATKPAQAATGAAPEAKPDAKPKAAPKPAAKAPAEAAPPAEPAKPKTEAEYEVYATARWQSMASESAIDAWWKSPAERNLRNDSFVTTPTRDRMIAAKQAWIDEHIKKKGGAK